MHYPSNTSFDPQMKHRIREKTNLLGMRIAAARGFASSLKNELAGVSDAVTMLRAENVPSINDALRSNDASSQLRDGINAVLNALERFGALRDEALSAHYADQRTPGFVN